MKKTLFSVIFSNFLSSGIGFFINVFLARFLSVEEYGRINLIFSFVIILFSLFEFNFGNALIVFYKKTLNTYKGDSNDLIFFVNRLFLRYLPLSIPLMIISLIVLKYTYNLSTLELTVVTLNFYLFLVYRYIATLHQSLGNWKTFNFLNVLNNIAKGLSVVLAVLFITTVTTKYQAILIGNSIFPFVVLLISLFYSKSLLKIRNLHNPKRYVKLFRSIITPLGISNIFIIISMRADNLIIEKVLGSEAVGIYAAANILALMFPLITSALRNVFMQEGAGKGIDFLKQILHQQKKYGIYIIGMLVIAFLLSKPAFSILYGSRYDESVIIFNILLIAYIGGIFFTPLESYFYSRSPKTIRNLKFMQMVIILVMSIILIYCIGLLGVAIAIVLSRLYGFVFLMWKTKRELKIYEKNN